MDKLKKRYAMYLIIIILSSFALLAMLEFSPQVGVALAALSLTLFTVVLIKTVKSESDELFNENEASIAKQKEAILKERNGKELELKSKTDDFNKTNAELKKLYIKALVANGVVFAIYFIVLFLPVEIFFGIKDVVLIIVSVLCVAVFFASIAYVANAQKASGVEEKSDLDRYDMRLKMIGAKNIMTAQTVIRSGKWSSYKLIKGSFEKGQKVILVDDDWNRVGGATLTEVKESKPGYYSVWIKIYGLDRDNDIETRGFRRLVSGVDEVE